MVDWIGLAIPFAYLIVLVGSLAAFSSVYRKRKAHQAHSLEPWFGEHVQRNMYYTLHNMAEDNKVPDTMIKAALLRRAAEDFNRIMYMQNSKQALQTLLARGSVGDDLWQRYQRAEKELEAELQDTVNEANAISPNWGQTLFQSAREIVQNQRLRQRIDEIQAQTEADRAWWEKKRATTRAEFLKELDEEDGSKADADSRRPSVAPSSTAGDKTGSDEDGVLVDADSTSTGSQTAPNTPSTATSQGGKKKKKNNKK